MPRHGGSPILSAAHDVSSYECPAHDVPSYNGTAHKVVVSTSIPVRFDSAAFKEAHPSLYEAFKAQGNPVTSARIHGR